MLLSDNVITRLSRKCQPGVWAANVVRLFYRRVPIPQCQHWAVVGFWMNFSGIPEFDQRSSEPVEHSLVMF